MSASTASSPEPRAPLRAAPTTDWRGWADGLVVVFVVALTWRMAALWAVSQEFYFAFRLGDAAAYDAWAREIVGGDWLGSAIFYQSPLYPYLLAAVYSTLGDSRLVVAALQAVGGAAACVLLCDAGARWFSPPTGLVAGLLLAVYAPAIFFDLLIQKSSLDLLLMCGLLWCLSRCARLEVCGNATVFAAGLMAGLLALNRENALGLLVVLAGWLAWQLRPAGANRLRPLMLFLAGAVAVLAPVVVRNRYVGGVWLLTTAQSGPNFYIGNHAGATGSYVPLVPAHGDARFEREDAVRLAKLATGRNLTTAEVSRYWWGEALAFVRSQPAEWARLLLLKAGLFWNQAELIDTEDLATYREASVALRWPGRVLSFGVLAVAAALGVWTDWRRSSGVRLLCLLIGVYALSVILFYVVGRYRLPVVPPLILLAALGLTQGLPQWPQSSWATRLRVVVVLMMTGVACAWPLIDEQQQRSGTLLNFGAELLDRSEAQHAVEVLRAALQINPDSPEANFNLGRAYVDLRRLEDAGFYFLRAAQLDPGFSEASLNLGNVTLELGQLDLAEPAFRHALQLAPRDYRVHHGLGLVLAARQQWPQAIEHLEKAVALAPEFGPARSNLELARRLSQTPSAGPPP